MTKRRVPARPPAPARAPGSSRSAPRRSAIQAAVLALALLLGCDERQGDTAGSATALPPMTEVAIGPQPGPDAALLRTSNPFADDMAAAVEGRLLFVLYNCSGCHGSRAGGGMGPSLRDSKWLYGGGDQEIYSSIAQGRSNGMPAWGTKLPASQIWLLVSYLQSLNTSIEPDAPPPNPSYPDAPNRE